MSRSVRQFGRERSISLRPESAPTKPPTNIFSLNSQAPAQPVKQRSQEALQMLYASTCLMWYHSSAHFDR